MKINKIDLTELFGFLAVAASLAFVGMQLMLDRKVAIAEQYANRSESAKEDRRAYLANPVIHQDMEESWARGERPSYWDENWELAKAVNGEEVSVAILYSRIVRIELTILGYDNIYFQYKQGLISEGSWLEFRRWIKTSIRNDPELTRALYIRSSRAVFKPEVERILQEIDSGL